MPSYPATVKAFTTKNSGDVVQASHINDAHDEINAMEAGLLNGTARLNSSNSTVANLSVTGGSTFAGGLNFGSNSTITGALSVTGNSTLAGNVVIGGTLSVVNHSSFAANLNVTGDSTLTGSLNVTGNSTMGAINIPTATLTGVLSPSTATPTANTLYTNNLVKAWAFASSAATLHRGFNVSSVTSSGTGGYGFAFITALASSEYAVMAVPVTAGVRVDISLQPGTFASTGFTVFVSDNAAGAAVNVPLQVMVVGP